MDSKIKKLLAEGLRQGFAGGTVVAGVKRGGFALKSSHFAADRSIYHDEWAADRVGAGQELVQVGNKKFTRVYAGGTISEKALADLKITKGDIMQFLKGQMIKNGDKIRADESFTPEPEGEWQYFYEVTDEEPKIPLVAGKEKITYKGKPVFVHCFLLCPVE